MKKSEDYLSEEELTFIKAYYHNIKRLNNPLFPCNIEEDPKTKVCYLEIPSSNFIFYTELLACHQLYGNGYCWLGIVEQLLEKTAPFLKKTIIIDAEGDAFYARSPYKQDIQMMAQLIHYLCKDKKRFDTFLEEIDKERIDA